MSRIIVKNLPVKITEEDLKKHFSVAGTVTDAKLKFKNGESRRFAFIGFKNSAEAISACQQFKDTYLLQNKILVEMCKDLNTEDMKNKYIENQNNKKNQAEDKNEDKVDAAENVIEKKQKYGNLYTIVIRTKEQNTNKDKHGRTFTKKGVKSFLKPLKYCSLRIPRKISYVAYVGFKLEKDMKQALLKDKSFLEGVRVRILKYENKKSNANNDYENDRWAAAKEKLASAEPVDESGKLFIRNLWYSATQEDLEELFSQIGPIADVTLPVCKSTRKIKGFAHVSYILPEHAQKAFQQLDGTIFQGRPLHILPSLLKDDDDSEDLNFKEKRDKKKKSKSSWHNWNSLFLGPAGVIDLLTKSLGQTKRDILIGEGNQSAAVTLALGETKIVEETKCFLEEEGVCLDSFTTSDIQRSSTILLVKHLPAFTKAHELKDIFDKHGELGRVVLPPSGLTAIIEFLDPSEAKIAYNDLAYTRFKSTPLYLEWAPIKTFNVHAKEKSAPDTDIKPSTTETSTTIYVKNLNFKTEEDGLKKHFKSIGELYTVKLARKRGLSQGYGFVQYNKSSDARNALITLNGSSLDGHYLTLKISDKNFIPEATPNVNSTDDTIAPVILVKNIPFDSPLSEIRDIFKVFGEISSIRLPRHLDNQQHRGFCFVDYLFKNCAQNAFQSLGLSTHLRGRRLVLEWAKENETVTDLRKRTADHFISSDTARKRQKVVLAEGGEEKIED